MYFATSKWHCTLKFLFLHSLARVAELEAIERQKNQENEESARQKAAEGETTPSPEDIRKFQAYLARVFNAK